MPIVTPRTETVVIEPVMGRRHRVRWWVATLAIGLAILTPLIFIVAALGAKFGLWGWGFGLGTLTRTVGKWALFATLGTGIVAVLMGWFLKPRRKRAITAGLIAVVVGVVGMAWASSVTAKARSLPFIHDITTDTQNPPVFEGRILGERAATRGVNTLDYTGKTDRGGTLVSVLQTEGYPDIRSIITSQPPEQAFARALVVAETLGWEITDQDVEAGRIEATETSFWYGFKDDVVIRVRPGAGGGSVVDLRSVSRVGGSDLGVNAERIRRFIARFKAPGSAE